MVVPTPDEGAPVPVYQTVPAAASIGIASLPFGPIYFRPGSSVTPSNNTDVVFELTSNTTFTIKAKGSDGTVRSGTVTLA